MNRFRIYLDLMNVTWVDRQRGFTILELLIVIVVIAILASVTLVAYNGVTERARLAGASQYASSFTDRYLADAVGYWSFNECSGSTVNNTAGNATTASASIAGTVSWSNDTPTGTGCSLAFDGTTYINTGIPLSNTYYSKSAWIKDTSSAISQNIISDGNSGVADDAMYLSGGNIQAGHNSTWNYVSYSPALTDGKWHYVVVTFTQNSGGTSGTMVLTVDGKTVSTNTNVPLMSNAATSFQAIGDFQGGNKFQGLIDNVMIVTQ